MSRCWCLVVALAGACGLPGIENFNRDGGAGSDASVLEPPPRDGHPDARLDGQVDARVDARPDAHPDAVPDAPPDAAPDASPDAPPGPCDLPPLDLTVATLAGCSDYGEIDGPRVIARFWNPVNVAVSAAGIAYVADFDSSRVRAVDLTGTATTLVSRSDFRRPFGLAIAPGGGALYVETDDNDLGIHSTTTGTIWKVNTATGAATVVERNLGSPRGLVVLPDGRLALSDHLHHVVGVLDPTTGDYQILAGQYDVPGHVNDVASAARFDEPYDMVLLDADTLVIADRANHRLRALTVSTGAVTDYAGTGASGTADGDQATAATFMRPQGLAMASDGTIYVTDVDARTIRRVAGGTVTTIAGSGVGGWQDSDDPLAAEFYENEGIDITADDTTLVVADGNQGDGTAEHRVRLVHLDSPSIPAKRVSLRGLVRAVTGL